jgi:RNA polymerase sigma-70 factor (ECF subfamily)
MKKTPLIGMDVINSAIAGNHNAYKTIYKKTYGSLFVICMRYSGNIDEAKDWCQEAYVKLFQALPKFNGKASFVTWSHRVFRNFCVDQYRKKVQPKTIGIDFYEEYPKEIEYDASVDAESLNDVDELLKIKAETILSALQQLPPAYRTVFNMFVMDDYSHKEIAEELNISVGASKSNLFKAKRKLKEVLLKKD